ncbi:EAL domain-containing protein [Mastigocoleus testarum]|uniref:EAL domain-containing protein n=1 Tax=Mastigocoleus testarum TaxID=996925 RepID=UPI001F209ECC|nr:EAL domain-containing protein [Mastigocoleus testarum]
MSQDPTTYAIVESINHVGHVMGLETIAENIENIQTIHMLQNIGVDYIQGFAVAQPKPWI